MRALLALSLLLLAAIAARGQGQERKLMDRIMKPDSSLEYDLRKSSFSTDRSVDTRKAKTADFSATRSFASREFDSKSFYGSKQAWGGNSKFSTKEASAARKNEFADATRKAPTKAMDVSSARESGKGADTHEYASAGRSYFQRGRSQDRFDSEKGVPKGTDQVGWTGELKPMTIDDVRTLLNKNK